MIFPASNTVKGVHRMDNDVCDMSGVMRSRQEAKQVYDRISWLYDFIGGNSEWPYVREGFDVMSVKSGESILEIGFGTGRGIIYLAHKVGPYGRIHGIDISENMNRLAAKRVRHEGFEKRVRLICGDAIQLPYHARFFDGIFMSFTLELFDISEIPIVLRECQRVLKPDGRMCLVTLARRSTDNSMVKIYEWLHEKFGKYIDCRPIAVSHLLITNGFRILKAVDKSIWGIPVEIVLGIKE